MCEQCVEICHDSYFQRIYWSTRELFKSKWRTQERNPWYVTHIVVNRTIRWNTERNSQTLAPQQETLTNAFIVLANTSASISMVFHTCRFRVLSPVVDVIFSFLLSLFAFEYRIYKKASPITRCVMLGCFELAWYFMYDTYAHPDCCTRIYVALSTWLHDINTGMRFARELHIYSKHE